MSCVPSCMTLSNNAARPWQQPPESCIDHITGRNGRVSPLNPHNCGFKSEAGREGMNKSRALFPLPVSANRSSAALSLPGGGGGRDAAKSMLPREKSSHNPKGKAKRNCAGPMYVSFLGPVYANPTRCGYSCQWARALCAVVK